MLCHFFTTKEAPPNNKTDGFFFGGAISGGQKIGNIIQKQLEPDIENMHQKILLDLY